MNNVAVYCRVATEEQCEPKTLLAQRLLCEQFVGVNPNGYEMYKKAIDEYNQKNKSQPI